VSPVFGGTVHPARAEIVDAAQLLKDFIDTQANRTLIPAGAVVGGADDKQQQAGVAVLMDAGTVKRELYAPLLWKRVQIRCLGKDLLHATQIGNYLFDFLDDQKWLELSDFWGQKWFVHMIYTDVAPSQHQDTSETKEDLMFVVMCIGRDPIP
jgi:hypothetical protein